MTGRPGLVVGRWEKGQANRERGDSRKTSCPSLGRNTSGDRKMHGEPKEGKKERFQAPPNVQTETSSKNTLDEKGSLYVDPPRRRDGTRGVKT